MRMCFILKTLNQIRRKPKVHVTRLPEPKIPKDNIKIVSTEPNIDADEVQLKKDSSSKEAVNCGNGLESGQQNGSGNYRINFFSDG